MKNNQLKRLRKDISPGIPDIPSFPKKKMEESKPLEKIISKKGLTFGERAADMLAIWAGSWTFILLFALFLIGWMAINIHFIFQWQRQPFDPYPFILLNLVLSCIAAIQAPIILMSQNRADIRDRARAEYDYAVNRKAEKEIRGIQKDITEIKLSLQKKRKKL